MKSKITLILISLLLVVTSILWNLHLKGLSYLRAADFLAIYYYITEYEKNYGKPPDKLEDVIPEYVRKDLFERSLNKITYKADRRYWALYESNSKYTRLFYKDRLAASSSVEPHWEKSELPASR